MEKEETRVRGRERQSETVRERERERRESKVNVTCKGIERHNNTYFESGFLLSIIFLVTRYIWLLQT